MSLHRFGWPWRTLPSKPIIQPVPPAMLESEIARLEPSQMLLEHGTFQVFCARPRQIPAVMLEIGRLRELSFRAVGEGTGEEFDLDRFDEHYDQLILWNSEAREVAGAYRLAIVGDTLRRSGPAGLYTASLFRLGRSFFDELGPAIELGRSFIRPEYQRRPHSLLLLWRAISRYLDQHPGHQTLFGPVSISAQYSAHARWAMADYFDRSTAGEPLRRHVQPRRRFHSPASGVTHERALTVQDLDRLVRSTGIEPDSKGIPVLLRHYLGLGGRVLSLSVDPAFSGCLDALIVVDLRQADRKLLERVTGRPAAVPAASGIRPPQPPAQEPGNGFPA